MYRSVFLLSSLWWTPGFTHAATDLTNTTHLVKNTDTDPQTGLSYAPIGTALPAHTWNPNLSPPSATPPPTASASATASGSRSASSTPTPSPTPEPTSSSSPSVSSSASSDSSSPSSVSRTLQGSSAVSYTAPSNRTLSLPPPTPPHRTGLSLGSIAAFWFVGLLWTCYEHQRAPGKGDRVRGSVFAETVLVDCV
jgi:hypothetical protein